MRTARRALPRRVDFFERFVDASERFFIEKVNDATDARRARRDDAQRDDATTRANRRGRERKRAGASRDAGRRAREDGRRDASRASISNALFLDSAFDRRERVEGVD